jgi:8-oxo-dGTP diphosphatase
MKPQKTNLRGLALFPISVILLLTTVWLGIAYAAITLPFKLSFRTLIQRWNQYFFVLAVSLDQFGNVAMQDLFNDWLLRPNAPHRFGNEDETISSVLGKNKTTHSLSKTGTLLADFLDWLDPNHVLNSIEPLP